MEANAKDDAKAGPVEFLGNQDNQLFFEYWKKCEDVAIHFNDLGARFRLQALAGLALAGGVLGGLKGPSTLLGWGLAVLLLAWIAVAAIDYLYYGRLLRGAVAEVKRLEEASGNALNLSTLIEQACSKPGIRGKENRLHYRWGRGIFYILPGLALGVSSLVTLSCDVETAKHRDEPAGVVASETD